MRDAYFAPMNLGQFTKKADLEGIAPKESDRIDLFDQGEKLTKFTQYMENEEAFGSILFRMAKKVFGSEFCDWESEAIILNLKDYYPNIPDINIDKILCFVALENSFDGRLCFFNELNCFRHTVNTLNNLEPDYQFLGALIPQHINWALYEVDQIHPGYKLDEEPARFLGISYHYIGALILPERLSEYQLFLDEYNQNSQLVSKMQEHCKECEARSIDDLDDEDVRDMQELMLRADLAYMDHRKREYMRDIELMV